MSSVISYLKARIVSLTKERVSLKVDICKYQGVIDSLKQKQESSKIETEAAIFMALNGRFSSNQIQSIITGKPVYSWREEDIVKALTLRSLSPKAYRFILKKWQIPLPPSSPIGRCASK